MKRLSIGTVRRALVVAPHPDDEAIGAWGLIRHLHRRGAAVRVVVVADGAASHPNSARWPPRRLVAERRRETLRAMRHIGVRARDCRFLGLPDGGLRSHPPHAITRAIATARADLILLPSAEDDHPDHRAVASAARRACTPGARRLTYLVWPAGRGTRGTVRLPLDNALAKRTAIARYRTQTGLIRDDPRGFAIAPHELRAFARPCEHFAVLPR